MDFYSFEKKCKLKCQHTLLFAGLRIRIYFIRIWIRIRRILIQHFRMNTDPDPGLLWPKNEKKLQLKKKLIFFWIKNYSLPIPRPP
jgi:hypothetical protein